jgi:hypothetical protein
MSLISQEKTHEQKVQDRKDLLIHKNKKMYNRLKLSLAEIFRLTWPEPVVEYIDGVETVTPPDMTPQEIFDLFGADSYKMFELCSEIQTMLLSVDANYQPLVPPYEYTINEDGTVTVGNYITPTESE